MNPKKRPVCDHCGGSNVTIDATVRWNWEKQDWEISDYLDNADCDDCQGETRIRWYHTSEQGRGILLDTEYLTTEGQS